MKTILYISCSPKATASMSETFGLEVLARLTGPGVEVIRRDLAACPPPFVDAGFCASIAGWPVDGAFEASEILIGELEAADAVVIATPMHNYTVPAVLKAWLDQVVRINRTFASTPAGKVGKLADRPVFIVAASGGWFTQPSPNGAPAQPDFLTPYLRAILGTIGLRDIRVLTLEGMTRGPEIAERAFASARAALEGMPGIG